MKGTPCCTGEYLEGFDGVVGVLVRVSNSRERGESLARNCGPGLGERISMPLPFTSSQPLDVPGTPEVGCHPARVSLDGVPGVAHAI